LRRFQSLKTERVINKERASAHPRRVATARALKDLLKQPGLKHRQYTTFNAVVSVASTTSSEGFSIYKPEYWMMLPPQVAWQPIPKKSRTLLFRKGQWLPVDRA
jgi:hypothetical protein